MKLTCGVGGPQTKVTPRRNTLLGVGPLTSHLLALEEITDYADYTELGIGVKQDMDMAKRWYMRAAGKPKPKPLWHLVMIDATRSNHADTP